MFWGWCDDVIIVHASLIGWKDKYKLYIYWGHIYELYFVMYWCVFCYNYMIDICLCYHDFVFHRNIPIVLGYALFILCFEKSNYLDWLLT